MRVRRQIPPVSAWRWRSSDLRSDAVKRWALYVAGAVLAGYLTAYLLVFPAPLLHAHEVVPRVLGLSVAEATSELKKVGLQIQDGGAQPDPTAPQGTIKDVSPAVGTLRAIKSPGELALLTKAIELSVDAHFEAMKMMRGPHQP